LADPAGPALTPRFVAGPDVDALDLTRAGLLAAVEGAVRPAPPTGRRAAQGGLGTRYATADLVVPADRLCAVRVGMADFEVVATAAGQRPAEDRGIT
jgi:hypothetical protein